MKSIMKLGVVALLFVAMLITVPVMAHDPAVFFEDAHGNDVTVYQRSPLEISLVDPIEVDVDNTFNPVNNVDVDVNNRNTNTNINLNTDINIVDQEQQQKQQQQQQQQQMQTQDNVQTNVQTVIIPQDAGGILISSSNKPPTVSQLDVGESQVFSRLVYPGEVLAFEVTNGNKISMRSASDVGLYTIGLFSQDVLKVGTIESTPVYDQYFHKMVFGLTVPVDKIDYWTTKATLTATEGASYVVVDNRAPRNSYTHIEVTITEGTPIVKDIVEVPQTVIAPDVYPVDSYGRAITS